MDDIERLRAAEGIDKLTEYECHEGLRHAICNGAHCPCNHQPDVQFVREGEEPVKRNLFIIGLPLRRRLLRRSFSTLFHILILNQSQSRKQSSSSSSILQESVVKEEKEREQGGERSAEWWNSGENPSVSKFILYILRITVGGK